MKYKAIALAVAAGLITVAPVRAEVGEVVIAQQYGIGYLPMTIMKHENLIEKHAAKAGLNNLKATWQVLGNASPINDGILAGTIHFGSGGAAPMIRLWDRTRDSLKVHGVAALCSMPMYLVTNNPNVKTIKDFTEKDRISITGAGQSAQTLFLWMEVAKHYGIDNYKKLNPLLVNLPHPDGLAALLSGQQVTAYFSAPPFQDRALQQPGVRKILSSYDVVGGPNSVFVMWASGKFRDENPKTYKVVHDALLEAQGILNQDKRKAAETYVKDTGGKDKVEDILKLLNNPEFVYSAAPTRMQPVAEFMHTADMIKKKPASWKDMFFPEVHGEKGS